MILGGEKSAKNFFYNVAKHTTASFFANKILFHASWYISHANKMREIIYITLVRSNLLDYNHITNKTTHAAINMNF